MTFYTTPSCNRKLNLVIVLDAKTKPCVNFLTSITVKSLIRFSDEKKLIELFAARSLYQRRLIANCYEIEYQKVRPLFHDFAKLVDITLRTLKRTIWFLKANYLLNKIFLHE